MPELPDVETFRRDLAAGALGHKITEAEIRASRMLRGTTPAKLRRRLKGSSFRRTRRHGKYLFVELQGDGWLLLHFGMSGSIARIGKGERAPPYTQLLVRFADGQGLVCLSRRKLGRIGVVKSPDAWVGEMKLGPDALSPGVPLARFRLMLAERRGSVKSALMDQRFLAGIGNIYSDEMLFQAHLDPDSEARKLNDAQAAALYRAMIRVLRTAIARRADSERMPSSWILPRRGKEDACPRCGGQLKRRAAAGRHTYFCPRCQKRAK